MLGIKMRFFKKPAPAEGLIHQLFEVGVTLKAIHSVLELIAGITVLLLSRWEIIHIARQLLGRELTERPQDFLVGIFLQGAQHLSAAKTFVAAYLCVSAVVNLLLVAGLYANKQWVYPTAMAILGLFTAYEVYRLSVHFSPVLAAVAPFDCLVILLIGLEYRRRWLVPAEGGLTTIFRRFD